jgi:hypothetical protein
MQESQAKLSTCLHPDQISSRLLECMMICSFHHLQGPVVEWVYPPPPVGRWSVKSNWEDVPMMAMPDGIHMTSKDCVASVFFAVQLFVPTGYEEEQSLVRETFYGAAIYAQIPSDSVVDASADVTRNFVQKSCCLMSRQPIFGWLVEKLQATASLYFDQRNFSNRTVLENLMDGLLSNTQSIPASLDFAQSLPIRCMVDILGDRLLICMKVLLLARPLIVLSRSATTSSSFSVALASLFPLTISSLADGSIAHQSSASFDRKACYPSVKLRSH